MRRVVGALILFAAACGGEKAKPAPAADTSTRPAPTPPAVTGTVHEVKMELVNGNYQFEPITLTIKPGDTVKWINFSGGPHNVQFKKDRVPAGADAVLNAAMAGRMGDLTGPFLIDSLATYQVSFANAPAGTYAYTCQPHEMRGMNATLSVQP
ncbi:MAG: hypothetical protein HY700_05320 [Gemmatimonadetes bacterium]|nr:hypothetical protein [Gemmatimonadota bacterium]